MAGRVDVARYVRQLSEYKTFQTALHLFINRLNYLRAVITTELSLEVLWRFLEKEKPEDKNDFEKNVWWMQKLKSVKKVFTKNEMKSIKEKAPKKMWDMTLLVKVIRECYEPSLSEDKRKSIKMLKDKRNDLCHRHTAELDGNGLDEHFKVLEENYTNLLGSDEARSFHDELDKVKTSKELSTACNSVYIANVMLFQLIS